MVEKVEKGGESTWYDELFFLYEAQWFDGWRARACSVADCGIVCLWGQLYFARRRASEDIRTRKESLTFSLDDEFDL